MDLIKIDYDNNSVNARDVYDYIFDGQEKKTAFNVWITRAISKYKKEDGVDFQSFMIESNGGRPRKEYAVTVEMAKDLCMVAPTKKGDETRAYFRKCEDIVKQTYAKKMSLRLLSIEQRKTLTDNVKESGENERMHGHGYSNFTKLAYRLCGIDEAFKTYKKEYKGDIGFRDLLDEDKLKRVETVEKMIAGLLELGKEYGEIKDVLEPVFKSVKGVE